MRPLVPLALALAAPLPAQRFITYTENPFEVRLVDTAAGAILESSRIDLTALQPPPGIATQGSAIPVLDEVWVAAGYYVYRFDQAGNQVGAIGPFAQPAYGLTRFAGSVWVGAVNELHEVATDGTPLNSYAATNALRSLLAWNGRLLASTTASVDEYDASGQFLGAFCQDPSLQLDLGQLADSPSTGNLLATGIVRIYEIDPAGKVVGDYDPGPFEQGVQELADGRLLVNTFQDALVFDRVTGETLQALSAVYLRAMAPYGPSGGSTERHCQANPNSTGAPARISAFGDLSLADDDLVLDVVSLPSGSFGLFFYGPGKAQLPWGDGFLCTGPFDLHRIQPAVVASPDGSASLNVVYAELPAAGAILPGSTWSFQLAYRDPAAGGTGLNSTDAVRLTFEP